MNSMSLLKMQRENKTSCRLSSLSIKKNSSLAKRQKRVGSTTLGLGSSKMESSLQNLGAFKSKFFPTNDSGILIMMIREG